MKLNLKAQGIELTPAISSYAEKRADSLSKYLGNPDAIVFFEVGKSTQHHKQGNVFRAEIRIQGAGRDFYATHEAEDLYAAIDLVRDEMVHELTHDKSKRVTLLRRGGRRLKEMVKGFPWINRKNQ